MATQHCPICSTVVPVNPRYPRYLCESCASKATSSDGRLLEFSNAGLSGGFVAGMRTRVRSMRAMNASSEGSSVMQTSPGSEGSSLRPSSDVAWQIQAVAGTPLPRNRNVSTTPTMNPPTCAI